MKSDWHAARYAAGEALAEASREALAEIVSSEFAVTKVSCLQLHHAPRLIAALAEYERTKDAP